MWSIYRRFFAVKRARRLLNSAAELKTNNGRCVVCCFRLHSRTESRHAAPGADLPHVNHKVAAGVKVFHGSQRAEFGSHAFVGIQLAEDFIRRGTQRLLSSPVTTQ